MGLLRSGVLADYWSWRCAQRDPPPFALVRAQAFEQEFEKRMAEFIVREAPNIPTETIEPARTTTWYRGGSKFGTRRTVIMD